MGLTMFPYMIQFVLDLRQVLYSVNLVNFVSPAQTARSRFILPSKLSLFGSTFYGTSAYLHSCLPQSTFTLIAQTLSRRALLHPNYFRRTHQQGQEEALQTVSHRIIIYSYMSQYAKGTLLLFSASCLQDLLFGRIFPHGTEAFSIAHVLYLAFEEGTPFNSNSFNPIYLITS